MLKPLNTPVVKRAVIRGVNVGVKAATIGFLEDVSGAAASTADESSQVRQLREAVAALIVIDGDAEEFARSLTVREALAALAASKEDAGPVPDFR